jgi:HEAT repeats
MEEAGSPSSTQCVKRGLPDKYCPLHTPPRSASIRDMPLLAPPAALPRASLASLATLAPFALLALAVGLALAARPALAAPRTPPGEASNVTKGAPLPPDAIRRLKSGDLAVIPGALDDVRVAGKGGTPAVPAISNLLEQGLPPELTQSAIETLGDTESETASVALAWYSRHRNVALRRAAVVALARTRGAAAIKALRATLSDPDPAVRGLSATGLGTMKAKEALADLFLALDHRVAEASPAIGQICAGSECEKLAAKLGSLPFAVITSGLDLALFRVPAEVSDEIKVKIVARLRELGTGEVNRFLRDVQGKWPKKGSAHVKQAIDQAVIATSGSPGSDDVSTRIDRGPKGDADAPLDSPGHRQNIRESL